MKHPFIDRSASVMVVEPSEARRVMLVAGLREMGFKNVADAASLEVAMEVMESQAIDWLITPLCAGSALNALKALSQFVREPAFRSCRVTFVIELSEIYCLSAAFEMGLFSWHETTKDVGSQLLRIAESIDVLKSYGNDDCLTAAHYLRQYLIGAELTADYLRLETSLISRFPDVPRLALTAAQALHLSGHPQAALQTLARAKDLPADVAAEAEALTRSITQAAGFDPDSEMQFAAQNGVRSCVIIDPDDAALNSLEDCLKSLGVPEITRFSDGEQAWTHFKDAPDPDLVILEWRVPGLLGPTLIQRLRAKGRSISPIVVYSALVKSSSDRSLLKELGVTEIIEKPMTKKQLLTVLSGIVREHRRPKTVNSAAQRIRAALQGRDLPQAEQLFEQIKGAHAEIPLGLALTLEAEITFHKGRYEEASSLAIKALHVAGEDILLLNLLGKIYMKLRQFEQAQSFFGRADAIAPGNIDRLCQIAEAQVERGKTSEAKETLGTVAVVDARNERVQETMAIVSISSGDLAAARSAMLDLDSMAGIISFMNNRAVALAMVRSLNESVELYECTLAAMPEHMADMKAIVSYNLALSLVKRGDAAAALKCLEKAPKAKAGYVHAKVISLVVKIKDALRTKTPVKLNVTDDRLSGPDDLEVTADSSRALPTATGVEAGTMRCHLVFQSSVRPSAEVWALLVDAPVARRPKQNVQKKAS